jgi:O-antigen ligase
MLYVAGWGCLLVLSVSKTSIALTLGVPIAIYALSWVSMGLRISVASLAATLAAVILTIASACYAILGTSLTDLVHLAWDDATFTGRTQLWNFMLDGIGENWVTGIGFASFWGVGASSPNLYAGLDYIRLTNQAHNGYLDLLATLGVIGVALVIIMLAQVLRKTEAFRFSQPWLFRFVWFIVAFSIIHNAMESSLLVPFSIVWHMTLLAYVMGVWYAQRAAS